MSNKWEARPPTEADRPLLEQWIKADVDHAGRCAPELWLVADPLKGSEVLVIEDTHGVVGFFRISNVMRIDAQFPPLTGAMREIAPKVWRPEEDGGMKIRLVKALVAGLAWLREKARKRRIAELQFDSVSKDLVSFFERQRFTKRSDVYESKLY
jgi:hypothetical protein